MAGFVQIIEWKTSRIDEVEELNREWRQRYSEMGPTRILVGADQENAESYMTIVEFSSHEEAKKNSADPATAEFSERMGALCDGPPTFHNLDVIYAEARE